MADSDLRMRVDESIDEYRDRNPESGLGNEKTRARLQQMRQDLSRLEQAEVISTKLTGDPHWNVYQQILQGWLDRLKVLNEKARDTLCGPGATTADEMMSVKFQVVATQAQIEILEEAQELPLAMRQASFNAKEALEAIEPWITGDEEAP